MNQLSPRQINYEINSLSGIVDTAGKVRDSRTAHNPVQVADSYLFALSEVLYACRDQEWVDNLRAIDDADLQEAVSLLCSYAEDTWSESLDMLKRAGMTGVNRPGATMINSYDRAEAWYNQKARDFAERNYNTHLDNLTEPQREAVRSQVHDYLVSVVSELDDYHSKMIYLLTEVAYYYEIFLSSIPSMRAVRNIKMRYTFGNIRDAIRMTEHNMELTGNNYQYDTAFLPALEKYIRGIRGAVPRSSDMWKFAGVFADYIRAFADEYQGYVTDSRLRIYPVDYQKGVYDLSEEAHAVDDIYSTYKTILNFLYVLNDDAPDRQILESEVYNRYKSLGSVKNNWSFNSTEDALSEAVSQLYSVGNQFYYDESFVYPGLYDYVKHIYDMSNDDSQVRKFTGVFLSYIDSFLQDYGDINTARDVYLLEGSRDTLDLTMNPDLAEDLHSQLEVIVEFLETLVDETSSNNLTETDMYNRYKSSGGAYRTVKAGLMNYPEPETPEKLAECLSILFDEIGSAQMTANQGQDWTGFISSVDAAGHAYRIIGWVNSSAEQNGRFSSSLGTHPWYSKPSAISDVVLELMKEINSIAEDFLDKADEHYLFWGIFFDDDTGYVDAESWAGYVREELYQKGFAEKEASSYISNAMLEIGSAAYKIFSVSRDIIKARDEILEIAESFNSSTRSHRYAKSIVSARVPQTLTDVEEYVYALVDELRGHNREITRGSQKGMFHALSALFVSSVYVEKMKLGQVQPGWMAQEYPELAALYNSVMSRFAEECGNTRARMSYSLNHSVSRFETGSGNVDADELAYYVNHWSEHNPEVQSLEDVFDVAASTAMPLIKLYSDLEAVADKASELLDAQF